jgi:hypothetical protein
MGPGGWQHRDKGFLLSTTSGKKHPFWQVQMIAKKVEGNTLKNSI